MSWFGNHYPFEDDDPPYREPKSECDDCPCKSCPKRKSCSRGSDDDEPGYGGGYWGNHGPYYDT